MEKEDNPLFNETFHAIFSDEKPSSIVKLEDKRRLKIMLRNFKLQAEEIFKTPYWKKMIIGSVATFLVLAPYNTLILWFPEVLERFAKFEHHYPNESSSVCIVSQRKELFDTNLVN